MDQSVDSKIPIILNRTSRTPLHRQVEQQVIEEILRGRLTAGAQMPSTRLLAEMLGVTRKTIVTAYEELTSQGWLSSSPTRGTYIASTFPENSPIKTKKDAGIVSRNLLTSDYMFTDRIGDVPMVTADPAALSFDDGLPDSRLLPARVIARSYRTALLQSSKYNLLHYADPRGSQKLRDILATFLTAGRGLAIEANNICLTRGSQMALFLAARALMLPGDVVALAELTYPPARHVFESAGARVIPVKIDACGINVDHLAQLCRRHKVKAVYTTPHHHFPTTVTMPPDRRARLLAIAEQYRFMIIEDDYDNEFSFDGAPLLPMASFAQPKIVYISSFSKLLAPSFRQGYVVASKTAIDAIAKQVLLVDRQGDAVTEHTMADLLESGEMARHLRKTLKIYRERRDVLAKSLRSSFGDMITFSVPNGGLAIWIQFAEDMLLNELEENALRNDVKILLSRSFQIHPSAPRGLRLGFASKNPAEIMASVRGLRKLLSI